MSKSLGNFIDLEAIELYVDKYSMDAWRYYLVTQGPLGATDADFVSERFHDIYNAHLVNTIGNCTSRVTAMIEKYFDGIVPSEYDGDSRMQLGEIDWPSKCSECVSKSIHAMEEFLIDQPAENAMSLIRDVDLFINDTEPYKLAKDASCRAELGAILYQCLEVLRIASLLLMPVMPNKMNEFHKAVGIDSQGSTLQESTSWGGTKSGTKIIKVALFPRAD